MTSANPTGTAPNRNFQSVEPQPKAGQLPHIDRGRFALALIYALVLLLAHTSNVEAQRVVSFPTSDGGVVYADEYGAGDQGVVLAHGGQFTKESWSEQAQALTNAGFRTLAIDFRGRGRSRGGSASSPGDGDAHLDVLAAIEYLRSSGAERISLVGASFGGWAVGRAATRAPGGDIDDIVLLAHSPIENPEALPGRKLFILARDDFSGGGVLRLPSIQDQYERAPAPKKLVILEGSAHAQHIFRTDQGDRLLREILDFLSGP